MNLANQNVLSICSCGFFILQHFNGKKKPQIYMYILEKPQDLYIYVRESINII